MFYYSLNSSSLRHISSGSVIKIQSSLTNVVYCSESDNRRSFGRQV